MPPTRNRPAWRTRSFAALFTAAWLAAACGGSTPPPPGTTAPPPSTSATAAASPAAASATSSPSPTPTPGPRADPADLLRDGRYEEAAVVYSGAAGEAEGDEAARQRIGEAVARTGAGDMAGAITALKAARDAAQPGSEDFTAATYLLGRRLAESGDSAAARDVLTPAPDAPHEGPLAPYLDYEYARALRRAGDPAGADAAFRALLARPGLSGELTTSAQRELTAIAADSGDSEGYVAILRDLAASTGDSGTRYQLAMALIEAGDSEGAVGHLRALVASGSGSTAFLALTELEALGQPVDPALAGFTLYRNGLYAEARARLTPVVEAGIASGETGADIAFATYYLAAAFDDDGLLEPALTLYDRLPDLAPGSELAHRAAYWAARTLEKAGDAPSASGRFAALAVAALPGPFTAEAAFRAGYVLLQAGDPAGALAAWGTTGATSDPRLLYWQGRALQDTGAALEAARTYTRAAIADPMSFYGLAAQARLDDDAPADVSYRHRKIDTFVDWDAIQTWLAGVAPGEAPALPLNPAASFLALGLRSEARGALEALPAATPWETFAVLREADRLGLTDVAGNLAVALRDQAGATWETAPRALMRLAYPIAYVAYLQEETALAGLDPLFVAAVIRLESLWQPDAVSIADARGLMQIIPPTGEGIAGELGVEDYRLEDLFRPVVSLRFGTYYLAEQMKRFGRPEAALAAYNGGPGNAERWLAAANGPSVADFAEAVDFPETRNYVQVITEHYAAYQVAWADE